MRFALFTASLAALGLVASVSAAPVAPVAARSAGDIQTVGKGVCFLEAGLGVTDIEDALDGALGGIITGIEDVLGITSLEDSLGLTSCEDETSGLSDVQLVGKGLCYIEKGLGVTDTEDFLDETLGGAVTDIEDKLGITSLEKELKLTGC
ncbi:hypothetical protein BCV69DRAFT_69739 [Microstroma glucosiphilum]|uniref:Uncharacterized protein n=1 Tax=Pseudomicrostroma glucosiphilum TaxID=1684307 RepID=A0A316U6V3_9BASI|nr:hypothetical protein BCV69DRAFT_69739 [Pseudomicrostroma glucosiphilum]PWN18665.1 hypothetical protein BCV69DRAFT_69739 [Pseudomicrostroma glucosiphilum]